jgi:hypothetical protein
MISSTFTKFANLCRQQINSNKGQMSASSSVKPTQNIPKVAPSIIQKTSEPARNISNSA